MAIYVCDEGVNHKIKKITRCKDGVNRKIKEDWRGVGGINRKVFSSELFAIGNPVDLLKNKFLIYKGKVGDLDDSHSISDDFLSLRAVGGDESCVLAYLINHKLKSGVYNIAFDINYDVSREAYGQIKYKYNTDTDIIINYYGTDIPFPHSESYGWSYKHVSFNLYNNPYENGYLALLFNLYTPSVNTGAGHTSTSSIDITIKNLFLTRVS